MPQRTTVPYPNGGVSWRFTITAQWDVPNAPRMSGCECGIRPFACLRRRTGRGHPPKSQLVREPASNRRQAAHSQPAISGDSTSSAPQKSACSPVFVAAGALRPAMLRRARSFCRDPRPSCRSLRQEAPARARGHAHCAAIARLPWRPRPPWHSQYRGTEPWPHPRSSP